MRQLRGERLVAAGPPLDRLADAQVQPRAVRPGEAAAVERLADERVAEREAFRSALDDEAGLQRLAVPGRDVGARPAEQVADQFQRHLAAADRGEREQLDRLGIEPREAAFDHAERAGRHADPVERARGLVAVGRGVRLGEPAQRLLDEERVAARALVQQPHQPGVGRLVAAAADERPAAGDVEAAEG
jgi:hypothetical protein